MAWTMSKRQKQTIKLLLSRPQTVDVMLGEYQQRCIQKPKLWLDCWTWFPYVDTGVDKSIIKPHSGAHMGAQTCSRDIKSGGFLELNIGDCFINLHKLTHQSNPRLYLDMNDKQHVYLLPIWMLLQQFHLDCAKDTHKGLKGIYEVIVIVSEMFSLHIFKNKNLIT